MTAGRKLAAILAADVVGRSPCPALHPSRRSVGASVDACFGRTLSADGLEEREQCARSRRMSGGWKPPCNGETERQNGEMVGLSGLSLFSGPIPAAVRCHLVTSSFALRLEAARWRANRPRLKGSGSR